jgi:hypothetical protein
MTEQIAEDQMPYYYGRHSAWWPFKTADATGQRILINAYEHPRMKLKKYYVWVHTTTAAATAVIERIGGTDVATVTSGTDAGSATAGTINGEPVFERSEPICINVTGAGTDFLGFFVVEFPRCPEETMKILKKAWAWIKARVATLRRN